MTHRLTDSQTHRLTDSQTHASQYTILIFSEAMMDASYNWACKQRRAYSHNNNIWDLRYNGTSIKLKLQKQLRDGHFYYPLWHTDPHAYENYLKNR